mgnify:CR=1 FL=1
MFEYQSSLHEKIIFSKRLMKEYEPSEGYILNFSGGKDSVVLLDLAKRAGIKFRAKYLITTIEHPESINFLKNFPEVELIQPKATISELIIKKGFPPLRKYRYCTTELKVKSGRDDFNLIGIRAQESKRRANLEPIKTEGRDRHLYPIFDWTEKDIWLYIGRYRLPYNPLYDCGYKRVGCVLCPFSTRWQIERELKAYPEIVEMYRESCRRAYEVKTAAGKVYRDIKNGDELFEWWLRCIQNK